MRRRPFHVPNAALVGVLLAAIALVLGGCGSGSPPGTEEADSDAILLESAADPTVTFGVWFKVGSQNDPAGKEGLAALTGALLAQGSTSEQSYEEILAALYPMAARYNARVDKEMTTFTGRTHGDNLDAFFELYTRAYLSPAFDQADFERIKSDQLNYLEKTLRYASDEELGKDALMHFVYEGTPYAHPIAGTVEGLGNITLEDVKNFYRRYYTRENAVVALGGGFSPELVARFEGTLEQLPGGAAPAAPEISPAAIEGRTAFLVQKDGADASISFGFPVGVSRGERDFYALWIANSWLGEHRNTASHLFQVIREARGMNYGDYSYIEAFPEGGQRQMPPTGVARQHQLFQVWIRTLPNDQAHFAVRAAFRELERLVNEGMGEEEFELTRAFLSKYHLHFAATTRERLGYKIDDAFYGIDGEGHLARFGEMMKSITREEVNAALKKHFDLANVKIAMITGDAEGLKEALQTDAPSPMEYAIAKPEEVLEEDKEIAVHPLNFAADGVTIVPVEQIFQK
ncbi:MAG: pitrilysin family protein [Acidobacteriota bacterium]